MSNMTPTPTAVASSMADSHTWHMMQSVGPAATAHGPAGHVHAGGMDGSPVNWFVIGGFATVVAASVFAASATKKRLRRRMMAGELAAAGVRDV